MQSYVGNLLAALAPRARIVPAVDPDAMSVDPAVVKHYKEDPLNFIGNVRVKSANEIMQVSVPGRLGLSWPTCTAGRVSQQGAGSVQAW